MKKQVKEIRYQSNSKQNRNRDIIEGQIVSTDLLTIDSPLNLHILFKKDSLIQTIQLAGKNSA